VRGELSNRREQLAGLLGIEPMTGGALHVQSMVSSWKWFFDKRIEELKGR